MVFKAVKQNIITGFVPQEENRDIIRYGKDKKDAHITALLEIKEVLSRNPFVEEQNVTIDGLIAMLQEVYRYSEMEVMVYKEIRNYTLFTPKLNHR